MEPTKKTYWVTKYLFTCGIEQKKLAVYSDPGYVHGDNWNLFRIGHERAQAGRQACGRWRG